MAMFQPAPGAPSRCDAGTRTSSKNTSQNSASSVICRSGRTVMPGVFMSTSSRLMPLCFGASGSVRQRRKHQSAMSAWLVHTFWPFTTYSSPRRSALVRSAGQVGAGAGLGEALAPELVAVHHRTQEAVALRLRAVLEERRPDQVDVGLGGRPWRAHLVERLVEEPALHHRGAAAAVLARPRDGGPAAVEEPPLPLPGDLDPHRVLDPRPAVVAPPLGRQVALEPVARLVGEGLVGGGEGEVHAGRDPSRAAPRLVRRASMANSCLYLHEIIDIVGTGSEAYKAHTGALGTNRSDGGAPLIGTWQQSGSTGAWPKVVNLWEMRGWDHWEEILARQYTRASGQEKKLGRWWKEATKFRSGGFDRILEPAPFSPTRADIVDARGARRSRACRRSRR